MNPGLALDKILFENTSEVRVELDPEAQGAIPESLRGTYYLNGPANFRRGDFFYDHWLDGDGLIRALRFGEKRTEYISRFVRSRKYLDEREAGHPVYRAFGTAFDGDRLRRKMALESPVNISVFRFGKHLLAFGEQCLPWELSTNDLETVGEFNFNGQLPDIIPFSAHPKIDAISGHLCNFGLKYLMASNKLCYWEFDRRLACVIAKALEVRAPFSIHDFALSRRFAAFYISPYMLDIAAFVRRGRSIFEALAWRPEDENELILFERRQEGSEVRLPLGRRGYCLHLVNCFDHGDALVLDLIETEEPLYTQYRPLPSLFATVKPCAFVRISIDVKSGTVLNVVKAMQEVHLDFPVLLPEARGQAYGQAWALAMPTQPVGIPKYYDQIIRFDWNQAKIAERYRAPDGIYLAGEPSVIKVIEPALDAALICPRWHSRENRSDYVILNAFRLSAPPLAVLPLPQASPLGFHSIFDPEL
jgi:carotenoid cleavage dioxygenase-like enzyme